MPRFDVVKLSCMSRKDRRAYFKLIPPSERSAYKARLRRYMNKISAQRTRDRRKVSHNKLLEVYEKCRDVVLCKQLSCTEKIQRLCHLMEIDPDHAFSNDIAEYAEDPLVLQQSVLYF